MAFLITCKKRQTYQILILLCHHGQSGAGPSALPAAAAASEEPPPAHGTWVGIDTLLVDSLAFIVCSLSVIGLAGGLHFPASLQTRVWTHVLAAWPVAASLAFRLAHVAYLARTQGPQSGTVFVGLRAAALMWLVALVGIFAPAGIVARRGGQNAAGGFWAASRFVIDVGGLGALSELLNFATTFAELSNRAISWRRQALAVLLLGGLNVICAGMHLNTESTTALMSAILGNFVMTLASFGAIFVTIMAAILADDKIAKAGLEPPKRE